MSLFGSLMGDFEEDPFFGAHMRTMRHMNNMMNSMFADPFGFMDNMGPPALPSPRPAVARRGGELMPFGFMNMNRMFEDFGTIRTNPNCHSFSSSTVMTMTSGPDGRPQVYQASSSTRTAPGGVKETKKTVCDSRTGVKKMAIGHHIGERGHILEREQNIHSGNREEHQEYINLEEEEAEDFNREFEEKARNSLGAITYGSSSRNNVSNRREHDAGRPIRALPAPPAGSSRLRSRGTIELRRRNYPSLPAASSLALSGESSSSPPPPNRPSATEPSSSTSADRSRKRDHEPDTQRSYKTLKPSHETTM